MTMNKRLFVIILVSATACVGWFSSCHHKKTETVPDIRIYFDSVFWHKKTPCTVITGKDTLYGKIKFRGGISSRYDKHSFTLKLEEKYPLEGLKAAKTFILNANYIDKTMMRHKISYDLFRKMRPERNKAAECRYLQLYLNDNYEGLYVLMEKLDAKRLGVDKHDSMSMIFKDPPLFWGEKRIVPQDSDNYYQQTYPKITEEDKTEYKEITHHEQTIWKELCATSTAESIRDMLEGVVEPPSNMGKNPVTKAPWAGYGTGRFLSVLRVYTCAGKTGTAELAKKQNAKDADKELAWFVAFRSRHLDGTELAPEEERLVLVMLEIDMTKQVDEWTQMKFLIAQALLKDDTLTGSPGSESCIEERTGEPDTVTTAAGNEGETGDGNHAG